MFFFMFLVFYSLAKASNQVPWGTFLSTSPVPQMASLQWTRKGMRKLTRKLGPSGPQWPMLLSPLELDPTFTGPSEKPSQSLQHTGLLTQTISLSFTLSVPNHCFSAKSSSDARL